MRRDELLFTVIFLVGMAVWMKGCSAWESDHKGEHPGLTDVQWQIYQEREIMPW